MSTNPGPEPVPSAYEDLRLADLEQVDAVCDQFIAAWRRGERPRLEALVASAPTAIQLHLASELIRAELELRRAAGERLLRGDVIVRFPQWSRELHALLSDVSDSEPLLPAQVPIQLIDPDSSVRDGSGTLVPAESLTPGSASQQAGHYELGDVLRVSSTGIVYRGRDTKANRDVAVSVLAPELARDPVMRTRFVREANAAAGLRHENIVAIYGVEDSSTQCRVVLELVSGMSLAELLRASGPLAVEDIISLGTQITAGLEAAHQRGVIHGGISPANILLIPGQNERPGSYRVKLTDFGMTRVVTEARVNVENINIAPQYLSPEQALSLPIDHRADLFSLGTVLYALCTGHEAFQGASPAALLRQVVEQASPRVGELNSALPGWLVAVVERLMLKRRDDRFQSAAEVLAALTDPLAAAPTSPPVSLLSPASRRRYAGVVLAVIGLLAAILIADPFGESAPARKDIPPTVVKTEADQNAVETKSEVEPVPPTVPIVPIAKSASAPFNRAQAQLHQADWAKQLDVPVEWTNSVGVKFVLIPPGEYTRGTTLESVAEFRAYFPDDGHMQLCFDSQSPPHRVVISKPFYLGTCEVTQQQYAAVIQHNPAAFSAHGKMSQTVEKQDTSHLPVETVSWNDAVLFCRRLSENEGHSLCYSPSDELVCEGTGYRLPSDAEWEYACRAGTESRHSNGDSDQDLHQVAWTSFQAGNEAGADAPPHAVGQLKANSFGLFDMHGNVWEWCQDWYDTHAGRQFANMPAIDPFGPLACPTRERVIRGGYYHGPPYRTYSANRDCCRLDLGFHHIGFRVLVSVDGVRSMIRKSE